MLAHASSSFSRWNTRSCACAYACAFACVAGENQALTPLELRFQVFSTTEGCFPGMIVCRSLQGALPVAKWENSCWTITLKSKGPKMFTDVPIEKKYEWMTKWMNELMFTYLETTKPGKRDQLANHCLLYFSFKDWGILWTKMITGFKLFKLYFIQKFQDSLTWRSVKATKLLYFEEEALVYWRSNVISFNRKMSRNGAAKSKMK